MHNYFDVKFAPNSHEMYCGKFGLILTQFSLIYTEILYMRHFKYKSLQCRTLMFLTVLLICIQLQNILAKV